MENNRAEKDNFQGSHSEPRPVFYEIKVQGQLDPRWSKRFEGMTLVHTENGESGVACTSIAGPVIDQPALHGLLAKIRDLNLTLISVRRLLPGKGSLEDVPIQPESSGGQDGLRNK